jgi:DNA/RNA endonuclease YhcR with UshA esterase domain
VVAWHHSGGRLRYSPRGQADHITATEASSHVGQVATVCDTVVSPKYLSSSRSQPTFLNLDKPYPNQVFTVVIFGSDRRKFGAPEVKYRGKRICSTGLIKVYRGVPEIIATEPSQIVEAQ